MNLSSIMTKNCQMSVAAAQDWDTPFHLDRYCIVELEFWRDNLRYVNARDVSSCNHLFTSVYSDASDVAVVISSVETFTPIGCSQRWSWLKVLPITNW